MSYCWSCSANIAMVWGIAWWIPPRKEKTKAARSPFQVRASQARYPGTSLRLPMLVTFSKGQYRVYSKYRRKSTYKYLLRSSPSCSLHPWETHDARRGPDPCLLSLSIKKDLRAGKYTISVHCLLLTLLSLHYRSTHHKQRKQAGKAVVSLARSAIY